MWGETLKQQYLRNIFMEMSLYPHLYYFIYLLVFGSPQIPGVKKITLLLMKSSSTIMLLSQRLRDFVQYLLKWSMDMGDFRVHLAMLDSFDHPLFHKKYFPLSASLRVSCLYSQSHFFMVLSLGLSLPRQSWWKRWFTFSTSYVCNSRCLIDLSKCYLQEHCLSGILRLLFCKKCFYSL